MRAAHETRDVYTGWLACIAAGLAVVVLVVAGLCWGMERFWREGIDANDHSPDANLANASVSAPANPQDGHTPVGNLTMPAPGTRTNLIESNARLHQFGWADSARQNVHIPVEDAMHLLVQRGKR